MPVGVTVAVEAMVGGPPEELTTAGGGTLAPVALGLTEAIGVAVVPP